MSDRQRPDGGGCSARAITGGTNLIGASLVGAVLLNTTFDGTEMICAIDLSGANLTGADMTAIDPVDLRDPEVVVLTAALPDRVGDRPP